MRFCLFQLLGLTFHQKHGAGGLNTNTNIAKTFTVTIPSSYFDGVSTKETNCRLIVCLKDKASHIDFL